MRPIKNFTGHPSLKDEADKYIFILPATKMMYLFTAEKVRRIRPIDIQSTNIGEPYKLLVRFLFLLDTEEDYLDIDVLEKPNLINMISSIGVELKLVKEEVHLTTTFNYKISDYTSSDALFTLDSYTKK